MAVEFEDIMVMTGDHVVQFYEHERQLGRAVGRYLTAAIEDGAVGLAIITEAHRRLLEAELESAGLDPETCRRDGSLILLDAAQTMSQFVDQGTVDPAGFQRVVGSVVRQATETGKPLRAFGEMVALLWEAGDVPAAIELERAWNELARELPFALVCVYRSESVQGDELAQPLLEVCFQHTAVLSAPHDRHARAAHDEAAGVDDISARFPAAGDSPRRARHFVGAALERWDRGASLLEDAQLVVTELATNAVVHAGAGFSVDVRQQGDRIRLAVHDASPARPILRDPDPLATSGRGLRIVAALAADWGVLPDPGGKTVWAELRS
jgi:anti-sigma regulatory factor (Ser/Thr protein kinase)